MSAMEDGYEHQKFLRLEVLEKIEKNDNLSSYQKKELNSLKAQREEYMKKIKEIYGEPMLFRRKLPDVHAYLHFDQSSILRVGEDAPPEVHGLWVIKLCSAYKRTLGIIYSAFTGKELK